MRRAILFAIGIFVAFVSLTTIRVISARQLPFDRDVWVEDLSIEGPQRLRMVDDILERELLLGKTREELDDLFGATWGNPEQFGTLDTREMLSRWDLAIEVGCRSRTGGCFGWGFWYDCTTFMVRFDSDGVTTEFGVLRD